MAYSTALVAENKFASKGNWGEKEPCHLGAFCYGPIAWGFWIGVADKDHWNYSIHQEQRLIFVNKEED